MSKIALSGNASGTGTLTIAAPNTNSDRTLTLPDQTATLITNSADVLNIGSGQFYKDASGNVGIGTSSPDVRLRITGANVANKGQLMLDSTNFAQMSFYNGATRYAQIYADVSGSNTGMYIVAATAQPLVFATNDVERARIDSSGNLLVGTTTSFPGSGNTSVGFMYETSGTFFVSRASGIAANFNRNSDGTNVSLRRSGAEVGAINVTSSSTAYVTSSDYRLKNTIAPMTGALAKVAALKPVTYKWNVDGSDGEGFIAHELAEVCPDAVTGEKDAVDAEGNPQYQGIDTSFLAATLTAAIQELKAIVDAQGAEIAALKGTA